MKLSLASASAILGLTTLASAQLSAAPIVLEIAPNSKTCPSDNTECRTGSQAAPYIAQGMQTYGIYSVKQMAAVIALMAYESGDFKYKHNVVPGRPGQGTANMQMASYNLLYAKSIPAVKSKVASISSVDGLSDDQLNSILALVTPDEYNFASGPWFLTTQCDSSVREKLDSDPDAGFQAYMDCIGTTLTSDRTAYWTRAKAAFGFS